MVKLLTELLFSLWAGLFIGSLVVVPSLARSHHDRYQQSYNEMSNINSCNDNKDRVPVLEPVYPLYMRRSPDLISLILAIRLSAVMPPLTINAHPHSAFVISCKLPFLSLNRISPLCY
ncbi:uncharacterized protein [Drosophila virilis]|uniref:uncharacterized protein n=1 Tax=Drosophila virilis TaxID=7244 RepID=UPI0013964E49|nr:uncharacterized protein LOC116652347 [Drosophila virilis]